jgi:U1 small nuclear ribonucleoprotein C
MYLCFQANVRSYYQQFEEQQTQSLIDQRIKEHLGQAAAFQQVGVGYNNLMVQRPNLPPVLPPPRFPIPGGQPPMPGFRPLMSRPLPVPGAPGECFPIHIFRGFYKTAIAYY